MAYSDIETYMDMFRNTKSYRASLKREDVVAYRIRQVCSISYFSCVAFFLFIPISILLLFADNSLQSLMSQYSEALFKLLFGSFLFICFAFALHIISLIVLLVKKSNFISAASLVICVFTDILMTYFFACIIYYIN